MKIIRRGMQTALNASWAVRHPVTAIKHALVNSTQPGSPLRLDSQAGWFGSGRAHSRHVTDRQMLSLTAAWRSVKIITETVGSLPLHLMERTGDVPLRARSHPLYDRLHTKSSKYQTSSAMIEQLVMSLALWNQAYIRHPGIGTRSELYAISPAFVKPVVINNGADVVWHVTENGTTSILTLDEITPIDGFRTPGALEGMAVAGMQREALSLAMAAEDYGARFFSTGGRPTGVLTTENVLKENQRNQLREKFSKLLSGGDLEDMGGLAVLEGGFKYSAISTSPDEAQFLQTRKHAVLDIVRIFGVPPHMLGEMDRATYANAEQNNTEFLTYTLLPYLRRIEDGINAFMLSDADRRKYFAKFSVEGLLRADSSGRAAFYREGRVGGWLTQNEIRRFEDLPRHEGADDLHVPMNMAPSDQLMEVIGNKTSEGPVES